MTVSKKVVDEFLNRDLNDFDWLKELSEEEVDEELDSLDPAPVFYGPDPFHHQKVCFLIGTYKKSFMYLLSPGTGKSRISLDLIAYHKDSGLVDKPVLVLVPNVANIGDWKDDAEKFQPGLDVVSLEGSSKERLKILQEYDADVFIINYDGLNALTTYKDSSKKKGKMSIDRDFANELFSYFDGAIFDEITAVKNHQSLTFQVCNILSKECKIRYGLTGTPFGLNPADLWPQFYMIDRGETLGETIGLFREAFCTQRRNYFSGFPEWHFDGRKKSRLHRMIKNRSLRYSDEECQDLPESVYIKRKVTLSKEAWDYYTDIWQEAIHSDKNYQSVKNSFIRMRQISSGFLGLKDDETGEKLQFDLKQNPKLDELEAIISEIPPDKKIVVFHEYIHSGELISKMLKKRKIQHSRLYSGTEDAAAEINRFRNDENCRVLVVNSKSGSLGLNLQVAPYCIFMESPVDPITRTQAEKRIDRTGQAESHIFYYDIVAENSVDERILGFLEEGKNLFKAIVEGENDL